MTTNIQTILNVQKFICAVLLLNVMIRGGQLIAEIIRQSKSHKTTK